MPPINRSTNIEGESEFVTKAVRENSLQKLVNIYDSNAPIVSE